MLDSDRLARATRRISNGSHGWYLIWLVWLAAAPVWAEDATHDAAATPALTVKSNEPTLRVTQDLVAETVLLDPLVANPLFICFDERGRLWLTEYRQYPWPAGLRLLSRDAVWRNRYEPPFAPPPPHATDSPFRGRDRISIHEDTDGDGTYDQSKVFLDGLNFATAALPGRGGVFVMNPPYLLFYEDKNQDDQPDDLQPRVLLSGFGIEDSHSIANSLRWGPDGWIYATQGSTVSGAIVRHGEDNLPLPGETPVTSLGQNLWRYHPERHVYEIFAEGGGNAFGVEIDRYGRTYSGHNGGNTRGFHYIQGGYYQKTFGKHGDLSNPFVFGYFPDMAHHNVQRFTHTFTVYESNELPSQYHGTLIGVNPVENHLMHSRIFADGSTRGTEDIGTIVEPGDGERASWFTPVDIKSGPDGALYVADWFSIQANHYRNHEGETNPDLGRVLRIRGKDQPTPTPFNLASLTTQDLVDRYLEHPNRWFRHQALRILGDRKDLSIRTELLERLRDKSDAFSLEAMWAFHLSGGLNGELTRELLQHPNEHVRRWAVRLWGDFPDPTDAATTLAVAKLAQTEPNAEVVSQIACTARRLTLSQQLVILPELLRRDEFATDPHIPLSIWWAIESIADEHDAVLSLFQEDDVWRRRWKPSGSRLWSNLVKRYVSQSTQASLQATARLLELGPSQQRDALLGAFAEAIQGRSLPSLPADLESQLAKSGGAFAAVLAIRQGDASMIRKTLDELQQSKYSDAEARQLIGALGDAKDADELVVHGLLQLLQGEKLVPLQIAVMVALQNYDDARIGKEIAGQLPNWPADLAETAESTLASRASWASFLLDSLEQSAIENIQPETLARLRLHSDPIVKRRVDELFPTADSDAAEMENQIARYLQIIGQGQGQPLNGQSLFFSKANCGKCHQLFSRGGQVGPDLTPYNRTKLRDILTAIVHPDAEVREGYENHTAVTVDGQVITGLKIEANDQLVVLRTVDGQNHTLAADEIEELRREPTSLMPKGLLDDLTENELRDLFAFLVSTTPPK